jgi:hypothetical protein
MRILITESAGFIGYNPHKYLAKYFDVTDGYLSIYLNSPLKKYSDIKLTYNDKDLKNYINFLQIFSMIEVLMFLIIFVKQIRKKIK